MLAPKKSINRYSYRTDTNLEESVEVDTKIEKNTYDDENVVCIYNSYLP